jgi:hypothetical protein
LQRQARVRARHERNYHRIAFQYNPTND